MGRFRELVEAKPRIFRKDDHRVWSIDREAVKEGNVFGDLVGIFETKENVKRYRVALYHLFEMAPKEMGKLDEVKLKSGEKLLRWCSITAAIGGFVPLIKVNADKGLVYFLKDTGDDEDIIFETKGTQVEWLRVKY